ncbi:MAG: hypothetical protein IKD80_04485 [Selenomonadaceae bacterium]|nr:hypothetical protein [Selenomonadaceae bacterium]
MLDFFAADDFGGQQRDKNVSTSDVATSFAVPKKFLKLVYVKLSTCEKKNLPAEKNMHRKIFRAARRIVRLKIFRACDIFRALCEKNMP